jgi:hypothetical protein
MDQSMEKNGEWRMMEEERENGKEEGREEGEGRERGKRTNLGGVLRFHRQSLEEY